MASGKADAAKQAVESYGHVTISEGVPFFMYEVHEPELTQQERAFADALIQSITSSKAQLLGIARGTEGILQPKFAALLHDRIIKRIEAGNMLEKIPSPNTAETLGAELSAFVQEAMPGSAKNAQNIVDYVVDNTIGYGPISEMMRDAELEEIMVNGFGTNVFIFHRKYGMCATNVPVRENEFMERLCTRIANTANRKFNISHPLLDARLPDGSRSNATFPYVSPAGLTLTIRKFSKSPLSVIDLIRRKTLSAELAAFLWVMVEGLNVEPMNIIISGGSGSGKTATLSALASFIKEHERVISIEDTLELSPRPDKNWIQLESRTSTKDAPEVTMDELLKNALRMRPDRLIVGEVRGIEAQTLFVAMDVGHSGIVGTLHANNARETIIRLKAKPMDVPEAMLPLLNLIVVQTRVYRKDKGLIRRVDHVAEIARMEERVLLSNIFEWDDAADLIKRTDVPMRVTEIMAMRAGMDKRQLMREVAVRQRILEWMLKKGITDVKKVEAIIQEYYRNPVGVLERITAS